VQLSATRGYGYCRRRTPDGILRTIVVQEDFYVADGDDRRKLALDVGKWRLVAETDWCGEGSTGASL